MFGLDMEKVVNEISDKVKPVIEQGKKQAELSLLVSTATQIYSAEIMHGGDPSINACVGIAQTIISDAKKRILT
jgi:hypothetical protein